MPFYEYQCKNCSEIYEIFIRNGEKVAEKCEVCGGRLHRIISVSTFHLKGSGWYITDYSRKNSQENTHKKPSEKGSNDKEEKSTSSTSDPKEALSKETVIHR